MQQAALRISEHFESLLQALTPTKTAPTFSRQMFHSDKLTIQPDPKLSSEWRGDLDIRRVPLLSGCQMCEIIRV